MFWSWKLINLKKMLFLKKQKMLQNLESSYWKVGWENFSFASNTSYWKLVCLFTFFASKFRQLLATFAKYFCSTEWFQQQQKLTNEIDNTQVDEIKCLAKFYVSVRKTDGSYYKKTSLLLIRAALDQNLKAPNFFKNVFFMLFSRMIINVIILRLGDYSPIFTMTNC